jgi:regulatory protein
VLDRLAHVGLVDDTAYAQAYVRTGVGVRRRGTRSLRAELRGRGVAPEVIDLAALEVDEDDERATALALAQRRAPALARLAPEVRRRRLMGLLLRRGFNSSVINDVLAEVLAAPDDEDGVGCAGLDEDDLSESSAAAGG